MTNPQLESLTSTSGSDPVTQHGPASAASSASAVETRPARVVAGVRTGFSAGRRGVVGLLARLPATARATRTAARGTVGALQTLPDPTLRSLAATSVGLGVGLSFTRARRVAFVVGMVPAVLIQAAIVGRPVKAHVPADGGV